MNEVMGAFVCPSSTMLPKTMHLVTTATKCLTLQDLICFYNLPVE